jgi:hypothetical protein
MQAIQPSNHLQPCAPEPHRVALGVLNKEGQLADAAATAAVRANLPFVVALLDFAVVH